MNYFGLEFIFETLWELLPASVQEALERGIWRARFLIALGLGLMAGMEAYLVHVRMTDLSGVSLVLGILPLTLGLKELADVWGRRRAEARARARRARWAAAHGLLGARCPYCHEAVEASDLPLVACSRCGTPHHEACFAEVGACTALGCGCRGVAALPGQPSSISSPPQIPRATFARTA